MTKRKPKTPEQQRREALRREVQQSMQAMRNTPARGSSGRAGRLGK